MDLGAGSAVKPEQLEECSPENCSSVDNKVVMNHGFKAQTDTEGQ